MTPTNVFNPILRPLILAGVKEPSPILREARDLVRRLPRATLELIENSQHGPNRENAPAFDAAVERLLTAVEDVDTRAA